MGSRSAHGRHSLTTPPSFRSHPAGALSPQRPRGNAAAHIESVGGGNGAGIADSTGAAYSAAATSIGAAAAAIGCGGGVDNYSLRNVVYTTCITSPAPAAAPATEKLARAEGAPPAAESCLLPGALGFSGVNDDGEWLGTNAQ
eukprot:6213627-Pleurochrysis_carterae.AAC.1